MRICKYKIALGLTIGARWNGVLAHLSDYAFYHIFCYDCKKIFFLTDWDLHLYSMILFLDGDNADLPISCCTRVDTGCQVEWGLGRKNN